MSFKNVFHILFLGALIGSTMAALGLKDSSPTDVSVLQAIRINSVKMAEANLRAQNACFFRTMCAVGTEEFVPSMTLASGINGFRDILDEVVMDIENAGIEKSVFPSVYRAVASHIVGKETRDLTMCERLFPCSKSAGLLLHEAITVSHRDSRATCTAVGALCPGVSIGCALCGVFAPGTCGQQCVVGGLYCGISAYSCKYAPDEE